MRLTALLVLAALTGCSGGGAQRPAATLDTSAPVTAAPGAAADDWSTFAHDQLRSGFQPQSTGIAKANVARLALRWLYQTGDGLQASPLVAGSRVYVASQRGEVRALDTRTGRLLWQTPTGATIAMTPALADGLLFVGDHRAPGAFMALDATSGKRLWQTFFAGGVRSEPVVAGGVVYEGETGGDGPACHHAALHALRERTGAELWRWYVDPHEHQGGSIWSPLSYDAGRVLFGTGNACESGIDTANAIVALDRSGRRLWSVRTADSIVDSDVGGGTLVLHGQAIVSSKNGNLYAVDEASGRVNWTTALGGVPGYGGFGTATTDGKTMQAPALRAIQAKPPVPRAARSLASTGTGRSSGRSAPPTPSTAPLRSRTESRLRRSTPRSLRSICEPARNCGRTRRVKRRIRRPPSCRAASTLRTTAAKCSRSTYPRNTVRCGVPRFA